MRFKKFFLLIISLTLLSCAPQRVTVVTDSEQYGVVRDRVYDMPVTYKSKYVELKGISNRICEIEIQRLDNLYHQIDANVFRCTSTFEGYDPLFFRIKEK